MFTRGVLAIRRVVDASLAEARRRVKQLSSTLDVIEESVRRLEMRR